MLYKTFNIILKRKLSALYIYVQVPDDVIQQMAAHFRQYRYKRATST